MRTLGVELMTYCLWLVSGGLFRVAWERDVKNKSSDLPASLYVASPAERFSKAVCCRALIR